MRPGKPLSFATRGATLVFGLPGNPVSALVGATLFVVPALRALQGMPSPGPEWHPGTLAVAAARSPWRDDFLRARLSVGESGAVLHPVQGQESHMIVRAAGADVLVHVPAGEGEIATGAVVRYARLA
jgi:molybdopterin molybdotransferase